MRLLEHESKTLLSRYGVPVPEGRVLISRADLGADAPVVVKAQVLSGGRGKAGAIRVARTADAARHAVDELLGATVLGEVVMSVLVEEHVDVQTELYLALLVDRTARTPLFLLSNQGGVDIEDVAPERIARVACEPRGPLASNAASELTGQLELSTATAESLQPILRAVYAAFIDTQAELIEINPLGLRADHRCVALDAKVNLDDRAAAHDPEFRELLAARRGSTDWERGAANHGMSAVELDGNVLVVAGGAGSSMATADLVAARGLSLAGVVDLSGGITLDRGTALSAMRHLASLGAPVVLYNAFTQVADCDLIAEAIIAGFALERDRVVVRMKGNNSIAGRARLAGKGFRVEEELAGACSQVAQLVAARLGV